jgi:NAD+ synthase
MKIEDREKVIKHIIQHIRGAMDYAVIGLSGGADSTLVACLCMEALGKENVYGVGMPYNEFDVDNFNSRSANFANKIGVNYHEVPVAAISDGIDNAVGFNDASCLTPVNRGNSRSRARMCVLYGFAHALANSNKRVRVVGTGNLSEDFIGYDTKGGDALGDIFPVGELYKSEIYQLLDYFIEKGVIEENHVDRVPSAGLEDGQTDEEDLGYSYDEMEYSIEFCLANYDIMQDGKIELPEITKFVWGRHIANKHKHEAPDVINVRNIL